jgi:hypothetical protein
VYKTRYLIANTCDAAPDTRCAILKLIELFAMFEPLKMISDCHELVELNPNGIIALTVPGPTFVKVIILSFSGASHGVACFPM